MLTEVQNRFITFVRERETARVSRTLGQNRPWCSDPIINEFKFCNVNREHDRVTRWIAKHVRPHLRKTHISTAVAQLYICRIFNEPATIEKIFPVNPDKALKTLQAMRNSGQKVLRGAYLCVPHGTSNAGRSTEEYFLDNMKKLLTHSRDLDRCFTLEQVAEVMRQVDGIGDFITNQVITDLRYTPGAYKWDCRDWPDWETFVLAGPGTRRGLNRYLGAGGVGTRRFPKIAGDCQPLLLKIRDNLRLVLPDDIAEHFRDPNNLSNCFCEFDKYERVRQQLAEGSRITVHRYAS